MGKAPASSAAFPHPPAEELRSKSSCSRRHGISATSQSSTCENLRTARCKKHGNMLIGTLRTYGPHFAKGCADDEKLSDVLHKLDEPSLSALVEDHEAGTLEAGCDG
jgi:hypothetical protein